HLAPDPEAPAKADHRGHAEAWAARRLTLDAAPPSRLRASLAPERFPDDPVLLAQVGGGIALARARAPRPAGVVERHRLGQGLLEPVADRAPGAHVLRLLLRPDDLLERRIRPQELG